MLKYLQFLNEKYTKKHLNPKFWDENINFDKKVEKKLLKIANDFYDTLDINMSIEDIHLTGSMANYNFTENSDLDVHIVVDFDDYDGEKEVLHDLMKTKAFVWNLKHNIIIRGADVELYVQDKNEEHISTGLYSLLNGEWIKKPKYTDPDVDEKDIESKFEKWKFEIIEIEKSLKKDLTDDESKEYYDRCEKLKNKLRKFRKKGLEGDGEFSVENIVFKKLRNEGWIEKLYKSSTEYYDMIFSQ